MPDSQLYESVPRDEVPIRMHLYDVMGTPGIHLHWHEHLELHYIIEGCMVLQCSQTTLEVKQGECVIINSNELHDAMGGEWRYFCRRIPPSLMKKHTVLFHSIVNQAELTEIIQHILAAFTHPNEMSDLILTGYAHLLMANLYQNHVLKEFDKPAHAAYSQKNKMLNATIKYIHDHYAEEISLDILSNRLHISKEHLCRIFKETTGQTMIEYVNGIRIEKAALLLVTTDLPVTEIAFLCGFQDSNYFTRKFRQIKGQTPSMTRKAVK